MASTTRIEELEKKFNENPRRYFAPLANEYRKAGDLEQAIAICRTYVPQQPAHMSGHIVFGQALFEAGEHEEARGVFEAALALDPENLIALRHLGDIARERGEIGAARTWYRRVLDADPRNDEVVALMSSLDTAPAAPAAAASGPPTWHEINPERTLELPPGMLDGDYAAVTAESDLPPGLRTTAPSIREISPLEMTLEPPPPLAPDRTRHDESTASNVEEHAHDDRSAGADYAHLDLVLPDPAPAATPSRVASPAATPEPIEPAWERRDDDAHAAASVPTGVTEGLEVMEFEPPPRAPTGEVSPVDAAPGDESTPAVFVTETMAELYLQQGFREEALNVYRQLLAQNPHDTTLRERVDQIERDVRPSADVVSATRDSVVGHEDQDARAIQPSARAFFSVLAQRRARQRHPLVASSPPSGGVEEEQLNVGVTEQASSPAVEQQHDAATEQPDGAATEQPSSQASEQASDPTPEQSFASTEHAPQLAVSSEPAADASASSTASREDPAAIPPGETAASPLSEPTADHSPTDAVPHDEHVPEPPSVRPAIEVTAASRASGAFPLEHLEYPETTLGSTGEAADFDVVAYEASEVVDARVARPTDQDGAPGEGSNGASATAVPESPDASTTHDTKSAEASAASMTPDDQPREPAWDAGNGAPPAAPTRKPMQTGSVNVLFPQQAIAASDEDAASRLSDAFGGPSPSAAVPPRQPSRAPANELSLDNIFREPEPSSEPQRQPTAFSFDRFFTDAPAAPAASTSEQPTTPDAATPEAADPLVADAEQFSNWLAGLKKK